MDDPLMTIIAILMMLLAFIVGMIARDTGINSVCKKYPQVLCVDEEYKDTRACVDYNYYKEIK